MNRFIKIFSSRLSISFSASISYANFVTMKLPEDKMKHVLRPGVVTLSDIFKRNGFEIRVAGGAVRDLLMGLIPTDLDFATTATPDEMKSMFETENIRMVNKGGERHGTITAHIEEENYECTTLRIDKVTDGRHAEVEFIRDWELDAGRRDLTINSLFLGLDGTIHDYFNGIKHIEENIVTFVGNPETRIQEDYLRILRYFRFFGRIAEDSSRHLPEVIDAIQRNVPGLGRVSGERIWVEMKKIIVGRFGGELILKMVECGVGPYIGLSEDFDCENLKRIYSRLNTCGLKNSDFHPMTLLASGFSSSEDATRLIERVKCSNKEKECLLTIIKYRKLMEGNNVNIDDVQDLLVDMFYKDKKAKDLALFAASELVKYAARVDLLPDVNGDLIPHFPIKGGMLVDKVEKKNQIQSEMKRLLDIWKKSNYTLGRDELLNEVGSKS